MQEPCRSCDRRAQDFGGCRCQALLVGGDAAATDPVCSLAPTRAKVDAIISGMLFDQFRPVVSPIPTIKNEPRPEVSEKPPWLYRPNPA